MKNRYIKIFLLGSSFLAFSCNKDLNIKPQQYILQSEALNSSDNVKVALVGAYHDFGAADFYGGRVFMEADLLADVNNLNWSGTYQQLTQIDNKSIPVDNSFVANVWISGYQVINDVNNVLSALPVVSAKDQNRVEGEAKFLSGASYFELVKMFGKAWNDGNPSTNPGVPIVLTPTTEITAASYVKRNTVAEVYAQVIKDLQDAEAKLPTTNGFYATKAAADAMLARVYLQQGDYQNTVQAANKAITLAEANKGDLTPNFADAFGPSNTIEDIFAVQVTTSSGTQGFNEFYSSSQRGDIQITNAHLQQYEPGDKRLDLFYTDNGSVYTGKFEYLHGNVHTIRLAEMYLTRAEANFRLGTALGDTPANDLNKVRARAGLPPLDPAALTLNDILKERKLELAFEGFWLDDAKRLQQNVGVLAWNSPKLIFPIPKREIVANPNLTQNEGY